MGSVIADQSMSLDGYSAAVGVRGATSLGAWGERLLHARMFRDDARGRNAAIRAVAGDRDVVILGGAATIRQFLVGGLLDELRIHLVPVALGGGARLFDRTGPEPIELLPTRVVGAPGATHFTLRVLATH